LACHTCFISQSFAPIGGIVGGMIGLMDGGTIGQICGAQMGFLSISLWQIGVTRPSTH
jgi:hypothetical protein